MTLLLEASALRHVYADGSIGLDDCSLAIRSGSRNALLGRNGSGKTTLLQHFNALLQPTGGQVRFAGLPVDYGRSGLNALRRRVGLVFQNPDRQLFSASVVEDVSFGPLNLGLDETTVRQRVGAALTAVGMSDLADKPVHHLSFGQKKRVCIAGVLAMQPDVLLLDEPMAGLDATMQIELQALLDSLTARGITPCIPPKSNRKVRYHYDKAIYKKRHLVENLFAKIKDWRRIHTRYDRCAHTFMSAICIAATVIFWLNQ